MQRNLEDDERVKFYSIRRDEGEEFVLAIINILGMECYPVSDSCELHPLRTLR